MEYDMNRVSNYPKKDMEYDMNRASHYPKKFPEKIPKKFPKKSPKKSLGQHFLTNTHISARIAEEANLSAKDTVLEIGPGKGMLTQELLSRAGRVVAVEKDNTLCAQLAETFYEASAQKRFALLCADILSFTPSEKTLGSKKYKIVANIPYNITGAILEHFLSATIQPESMILLVQKEVAERIARTKTARAKKGSILSISVKAYGVPRYIATVKAGNFYPKPKVDSAILAIEHISRANFENRAEESHFFDILHAGFAHKRKLLWRNIEKFGDIRPTLVSLGVSEGARSEELSVEQWLAIARSVK
jgi:16S rRNA (adenine1518-N6/adenine1519-N6)-dimethyltransferase